MEPMEFAHENWKENENLNVLISFDKDTNHFILELLKSIRIEINKLWQINKLKPLFLLHKICCYMKKIIVLFALAFLFQSCDDGDLTLKTFNFNNETVQECNDLLYVVNDNEIIILNIPTSNFINEATVVGTPRIYTLTSNDQLIYRLYDGNVSSTTICSTIPPATPNTVEEYKAQAGGQIQIITTVLPVVNETTKATTITYTHQIKLINVQFVNGDKTLNYEEFLFGNYTSLINTLAFNFSANNSTQCNTHNLYKNNSNQLITFDFPDYVLPTTAGTSSISLNSTNTITYKLFSGATLTSAEICSATSPNSPFVLEEEWIATEGTVNIITTDVTGTNNLPAKLYEITFSNIVYKKGDLSFTHDTFDFGDYLTN